MPICYDFVVYLSGLLIVQAFRPLSSAFHLYLLTILSIGALFFGDASYTLSFLRCGLRSVLFMMIGFPTLEGLGRKGHRKNNKDGGKY